MEQFRIRLLEDLLGGEKEIEREAVFPYVVQRDYLTREQLKRIEKRGT